MHGQLSAGLDPGPHTTSHLTAFRARDPVDTDLHAGRGAAVTGSTGNRVLVVRRVSLPRVTAGISLGARIVRCPHLTETTAAQGFSNQKGTLR